MKKFLIGATLAIVAALSFSTTSEAHYRWWPGHHHYWNHGYWNHGYYGAFVIGGPRYEDDYCFFKKIHRVDHWGNDYVEHVRVCG